MKTVQRNNGIARKQFLENPSISNEEQNFLLDEFRKRQHPDKHYTSYCRRGAWAKSGWESGGSCDVVMLSETDANIVQIIHITDPLTCYKRNLNMFCTPVRPILCLI